MRCWRLLSIHFVDGLAFKPVSRMLSVYQTVVEYHMCHVVGMILIGVVINVRPGPSLVRWAIMLARPIGEGRMVARERTPGRMKYGGLR